jgi:EAL and modified HD-GYP domain-containing signal transduction protein
MIVIDVMPDVDPDADVVGALDFQARLGVRICLDQWSFSAARAPLLAHAHFVKLDARAGEEVLTLELLALKPYRVQTIATNIDTRTLHQQCIALGFDFFQGNFLGHVDVVAGQALSHQGASMMHLLARLYDPDVNMGEVERLIAQDPLLTFRLLSCVNSAMYARSKPVDSIRQALTFLGLRQVASWVAIISLARMDDRPPEILMNAMVRAKMAQLLARGNKLLDADRMFTVGLLSLFDVLMSAPMAQLLERLPLSSEVADALLTRGGRMGDLLRVVEAHESHDWDKLRGADFEPAAVNDAWLSALGWADEAARVAHLVATPPPAPRQTARTRYTPP